MASSSENVPTADTDDGFSKLLAWERAVAELCTNASDDDVKECLRNYDPSKSSVELTQIFKQRCRKQPLLKTLNYLGYYPDKISVKELVDLVVLRVKNFFPDTCGICKEEYCSKINDTHFIACSSCGQEVHKQCYLKALNDVGLLTSDTSSSIDFLRIPGFHFLCEGCEEEHLLNRNHTARNNESSTTPIGTENCIQHDENLVLSQPPSTPPPSEDILPSLIHPRPPPDICNYISPTIIVNKAPPTEIDDDSDDDVVFEQNNYDSSEKTHRTDFMKNRQQISDNLNKPLAWETNDVRHSITPDVVVEQPVKICKFFRNNSCEHGMRGRACKFQHPKICKKLMAHGTRQPRGCNKGRKCKDFHPLMCMNSLRKGQCFDEHCGLYHVKKTVRVQKPDQRSDQTRNKNVQPPLLNKLQVNTPVRQQTESQQSNTPNQNFLELIQILKSDMEMKIQMLSSQLGRMMQNVQYQQQQITQQNNHAPHQQAYLPNPHHTRMPMFYQPPPVPNLVNY